STFPASVVAETNWRPLGERSETPTSLAAPPVPASAARVVASVSAAATAQRVRLLAMVSVVGCLDFKVADSLGRRLEAARPDQRVDVQPRLDPLGDQLELARSFRGEAH